PSLIVFLYLPRQPLSPHSFPTRRSSDLRSVPSGSAQCCLYTICLLANSSIASGPSSRPTPERLTPPKGRYSRVPSGELRKTMPADRKSTRLNSSHVSISYAVFRLKKNKV